MFFIHQNLFHLSICTGLRQVNFIFKGILYLKFCIYSVKIAYYRDLLKVVYSNNLRLFI